MEREDGRPEFGYSISELRYSGTKNDSVVVAIRGDLDTATTPRLTDALRDVLLSPNTDVALDLTAVEFMDSSGVRFLARAIAARRSVGRSLEVSAASSCVRRVLQLVGLDRVLRLPPTADSDEQ